MSVVGQSSSPEPQNPFTFAKVHRLIASNHPAVGSDHRGPKEKAMDVELPLVGVSRGAAGPHPTA